MNDTKYHNKPKKQPKIQKVSGNLCKSFGVWVFCFFLIVCFVVLLFCLLVVLFFGFMLLFVCLIFCLFQSSLVSTKDKSDFECTETADLTY